MTVTDNSGPAAYAEDARVYRLPGDPRIVLEYAGTGPLVLFLHGIGGDRSSWTYQIEAFSDRYCAAAWDARGYGDSDDYAGPLDFADMGDDVVRALDAFAVDKAHIVGTSMGGRIALECHARHSERFASLTLAGVHARFGDFSEEARQNFVSMRSKPLVEDGLKPSDIAPRVITRLTAPTVREEARTRAISSMSRLHKDSYIKTVEATTNFDREHVLGEIRVPTLVIGGEFDPLTPPELTRTVANKIRDARYQLIYGVGHLGNLENPVEFNRLLGNFLDAYHDRANLAADPYLVAGC